MPSRRWGDREGKRRDALQVARRILEDEGPRALGMRKVAGEAKISLGALYSYFATKEELVGTLLSARLDELGVELAEAAPRATTLTELLDRVFTAVLGYWTPYGRCLDLWPLLADAGKVSEGLRAELVHKTQVLLVELVPHIARTAAAQGRRLRDDPRVLSFLWTTTTGFAQHYSGARADAGVPWTDMLPFAADALMRAVTEEIP